jgi:GDP-D-mannose dehydratase
MAFPLKQDGRLSCITGSLTDAQNITMLAQLRPNLIFHLASIVSGEAESNFDAGWQVNMFTMWHYLEAVRFQALSVTPAADKFLAIGNPIDVSHSEAKVALPRNIGF